jgi:glycosyltransferase involved in cell wall biosynthesis
MTQPVSVIIPCYRQEQWVEAAALSAFKQAEDVTVVFDRPTYNERTDLPEWSVEQWATVYSSGDGFHTGVCYARNMGIDAASHEFILPVDADDQLYPDAIDRLYEQWQPGTWVYGNHTEIDEQGNVLREVEAPPPGMLHRKNLTYATFLFHKDDWQRAGGYDPTFEIGCEDYAFQIALAAAGVRPVKLEGAPIYKRMIHPASRTSVAVEHFPILQNLMRRKWPSIFQLNKS